MVRLAKEWYGKHEHTDWIVKHGCRTLLKKGNREVLAIFGYSDTAAARIFDFALAANTVVIGKELGFSFTVCAKEPVKVRLEYGIDYMKKSGKRNRKIFKISEVLLKAGEQKQYLKNHSFADMTVRKHYPGIHTLSLVVNGMERGQLDFDLDHA